MWREGELYRQRKELAAQQNSTAKVDHVSSSMGSLALGGGKRAKGFDGKEKSSAASASGWVDPNQGNNLRAARAAAQSSSRSGGGSNGGSSNGASGGGGSSGSWARGVGSRLTRK
jgi:hypothetical protein